MFMAIQRSPNLDDKKITQKFTIFKSPKVQISAMKKFYAEHALCKGSSITYIYIEKNTLFCLSILSSQNRQKSYIHHEYACARRHYRLHRSLYLIIQQSVATAIRYVISG